MIRILWFPAPGRSLSAAALASLALAACGEKRPEPPPVTTVARTSSAPTPVLNAAGPTVVVPSAPDASVRRAVSYESADAAFKAGDFGEARLLFTAYTASTPENAWGHYMLGLSAWKSGDLRGAEAAFETALEKDPHHLKTLLNSTRVLLELQRAPEALERITAARAVDSSSAEALRLLARVQDELGDAEAAIRSYQETLVRDERDLWAMNNLGMLFIRQRDFPAALPPLARAVQLKPTAPVFQNNLGIALELAGYPLAARQAYADALRADSSFAKAVANAKRLGDPVADSDNHEGVSVRELAETFRLQIKAWKDSLPQ